MIPLNVFEPLVTFDIFGIVGKDVSPSIVSIRGGGLNVSGLVTL
jgi:hypothetical protein